ncbi:MAG: sulfatase-like hydrolase/transferase, partial [Methylococcales bacterium]|nr:sulfatase-like hydrolase/transferase [Methylococcales bacterium]
LANNGVRFDRAYVQAPVCGPSRASIYTGRYQSTLGVRHNEFPLRIEEWGLGDYLRPLGWRTAVAGKTDLQLDPETAKILGIDLDNNVLRREVGFEPFERDEGIHLSQLEHVVYNEYLREQGYEGENPWHTYANSVVDENGDIQDGSFNRYAKHPANIKEEHSETPYLTSRAIEFMDTAAADTPWCLHLSYIKPHWPYIAPAPYHNMYRADQILPANRTEAERAEPHHPVYAGMLQNCEGEGFDRDEVRETVIPTYMGLIKQIDDQLGRLFAWMREKGVFEQTMIIFSSDHGDYLGDHWLVDKYWFHEEAARVPFIIYDPSPEADGTRGMVCDELMEMIDIVPTCIEFAGGVPNPKRLEGRSLMGFLWGKMPAKWRTHIICEEDYSMLAVRHHLDLPIAEARATM